ncbi:TetR/AcrR family transcriptional regulator [Amycolatopsis sp. NPDC049253]|jgi:TetR/AcrR family transcriptional repressor of nem operon|uniref:TetR/AcrR family transcriptional regulator n=1 Tax=Amycolatopsis sp. NPDC049253 TaxID=3155274 RepID=UPI00341A0261
MGRVRQFDPDVAVEQAMQVFWRQGYAATTPQDLVDALGIGKGSLYHAFGSKHGVFERALRRYRDRQAQRLVDALGEPGPVKERLRRALRELVEMDLADPDRRGCLAVNTAAELGGGDAAAAGSVAWMFDHDEEAFRSVVEEGQQAGELAPGRDSRAVASMLLTTVVGLRVLSRLPGGRERALRVVDATIAAL